MKKFLFDIVLKHFLTPEKVLPLVFDWLQKEWEKGQENVADFLYQNLFMRIFGDKATPKESFDLVKAVTKFFEKASKTDEWHTVVNKFTALTEK